MTRFRREEREPGELSPEELEAQEGGTLPDREALLIVRGDVSIPLDPDIAADVLLGQDVGGDEEA